MGKVTNKKVLVDKTNTSCNKPSTSAHKHENTSTDDEFEEPKLFHELKSPLTRKANTKKKALSSDKFMKVDTDVIETNSDKTDSINEETDSESDTDDDFEEVVSFHTISKPKTKLKEIPKGEIDSFDKTESLPLSLRAKKLPEKSSAKTKKSKTNPKEVIPASKDVPEASNKTTHLKETNTKRKSTTKSKEEFSPPHQDNSSKNNAKRKLTAKQNDDTSTLTQISLNETTTTSKKRKLHLLDVLSGVQSGRVSKARLSNSALPPILEQVSKFQVYKCVTPFDRRVTALDWHPTHPNILTVGSKGGDLILWNYECNNNNDNSGRDSFKSMIKGRGPGGSIQALKFDRNNDHRVYTASIDGKIALRDFDGNQFSKVLLEFDMAAHNWNRWYTGLDVSFSGKVIVAGDSLGWVTLLTLDGQNVFKGRLHKGKCNHVQFSRREPWMMVTTSTDHTAKIWDIRKLDGPKSVLATLNHDKAVNSAFFSPVAGDRLLTTDQHSQLRVYQGPWFDRSTVIPHPHRQFQHLTPIKAVWHPLADIPIAGRYPDPLFPGYQVGEKRSIDLFDPDTGERVVELYQPGMDKIISLSQFSPAGDALLSGMGQSVLVWKQKPDWEVKYDENVSNLEGVKVEQWPGLRQGKRKTVKTKKVKTSD